MVFLIIIPKIFGKVKWCFRDFGGGNLDLGERGKKPHTFRTYRGTGRGVRGPPPAPRFEDQIPRIPKYFSFVIPYVPIHRHPKYFYSEVHRHPKYLPRRYFGSPHTSERKVF